MQTATPSNKDTLGEWIRVHRLERRLTLAEVATRIGVSAGHVSEWETGQRVPSPANLEKLAGVLAGNPPEAGMVGVNPSHVWEDEQGVAWIDDTNTKVVEVVRDRLAGLTDEQIHAEYPELSLGQIHGAFSYYFDHQELLEEELRRRAARIEELQKAQPPSGARSRIEALRGR